MRCACRILLSLIALRDVRRRQEKWSLAMGKLLDGKSQTFKKLCQKGLSEFRAWPGQHVRTLPRGRKVPFSFKDHKLVCHLSGSEELRKNLLEVQKEKEREAAEAAAEIQPLLRLLPDPIFEVVQHHIREVGSNPMEIVISVGRPLEFRWKPMGERLMRSDFLGEPATKENVQLVVQRIGQKKFTIQDRAGIDGTLHRISAARNQSGQVVTLIMRVGRASSNLAGLLEDILADSNSILMLGPPGASRQAELQGLRWDFIFLSVTAAVERLRPIAACSSKCSSSAASKPICFWFVPSADLQEAMGLSGSHLHCETVRDVSPFTTEIIVVNNMQTPLLLIEARHHGDATPANGIEHQVPPGEHAIMSGYLVEPRATIFIRTGLHTAKKIQVPNLGRISVSNEPHGLRVETVDECVTIEDFDGDAALIKGNDTVPMLMRNEHFKDVAPENSPQAIKVGGA
ncbi:Uncharacterized protein ycf45 [Symbiodinium microadriaticum]|uniref:Uncharacterized protein ycf45 n=1 Tax=Symbiodinium microadriaticum TaxID=2951 RepID=A0A1Q9DNF1_SYMMI|nr:Uncharacterized protein ycf45 [Symbiodinium microadriaticum]